MHLIERVRVPNLSHQLTGFLNVSRCASMEAAASVLRSLPIALVIRAMDLLDLATCECYLLRAHEYILTALLGLTVSGMSLE